jgi:hypothetical protein
MTTSTNATIECGAGIGRMSDADYDVEYGTPRPKGGVPPSDHQGVTFGPWTFTKAAAAEAAEIKRKRFASSRTDYRMENMHVMKAFNDLEADIQAAQDGGTMTPSDFRLLKQAICRFRARIVVHDGLTFNGLKELQARCDAELVQHTAMVQDLVTSTSTTTFETIDAALIHAETIQSHQEKNTDLAHWNTALSREIHRLTYEKGADRVPPQHVELARSSGTTLQNVLSPQTIRRRFVSLSALTRAIRTDVQEFLTSSARGKDRATVVQQIKKSCAAAKKKAKAAVSAPAH